MDTYDLAAAAGRKLTVKNLEAARDLHRQLDHRLQDDPSKPGQPKNVRYFCFSGTRQSTFAFVTVCDTVTRFEVRGAERDDASDGTVPFWSSILPGVQCLSAGGEHSVLYKDQTVRRTLAALMGMRGVLGPVSF